MAFVIGQPILKCGVCPILGVMSVLRFIKRVLQLVHDFHVKNLDCFDPLFFTLPLNSIIAIADMLIIKTIDLLLGFPVPLNNVIFPDYFRYFLLALRLWFPVAILFKFGVDCYSFDCHCH